jgi:C1A family cysteine protease
MRKLNWKPDLPDHRDFLYSLHVMKAAKHKTIFPTKVDLRPLCSPVVDQGDIGSCTGNSLTGHLEFLELQQHKIAGIQPEEFDPVKFDSFSRLFIYYNERVIEGTVNQDSGAQLRDGIKALATQGACKESTWLYSSTNEFLQPSPAAYAEAANHKISLYLRLNNIGEMKHCLADGYPFVFGFTVYSSFESNHVAQTGIVPMPSKNDELQGGHAVCAVGYDDTKKVIIVRNSWGPDWGDKGYFYLPYAYISNPNLADDFWTIRK